MMRKKQGWGSCFGDFSDFSYFFPGLLRLFCCDWGAVLWILAVSATFFMDFSSCFAGFGELFLGFQQFQLLFSGIFPAVSLGLGSCFSNFSSFSYFFPEFFQLLDWIQGAVLEVLWITATQKTVSGEADYTVTCSSKFVPYDFPQ